MRNLVQIVYNGPGAWRLIRSGRQLGADLIYERYALFNLAGIVAAKAIDAPILVEVNSAFARLDSDLVPGILQVPAQLIEDCVLKAADAVIAVSAELACFLTDRLEIHPDKIHVLHNAVEADRFFPSKRRRRNARSALGLEGAFVIGYAGYFLSVAEPLLAIIEEVSERIEEALFLVVGGGPELDSFRRNLHVRGLSDRVRFTGRVEHDEMPFYLSSFDVGVDFAHPAWESPVKIFEYMGMALPIVVQDTPAISEVIQHGKTGLLVPRGDTALSSQAIVRLYRDLTLRRQLSAAAREYVLSNHRWVDNADRIVEIYRQVAGRPTGF